jgi:hypothetical protein
MKGKGSVGVGRVVISKRERPIILEPFGKGIRAMMLRYPYEVRKAVVDFLKIAPRLMLSGVDREVRGRTAIRSAKSIHEVSMAASLCASRTGCCYRWAWTSTLRVWPGDMRGKAMGTVPESKEMAMLPSSVFSPRISI